MYRDRNERDALDRILEKLIEIDERMDKIENYLERQKGFLGAIVFIGSTLAWAASYVRDWWKP